MLPLFEDASTSTRDIHDNSWLLWQLMWLYKDTSLASDALKAVLRKAINSQSNMRAEADAIRQSWMLECGLPGEERKGTDKISCPVRRLRHIIEMLFPIVWEPRDQLRLFLRSLAGVPDEQWNVMEKWLAEDPNPLSSNQRFGVTALNSYAWLTPEDISSVLLEDTTGAHLLTQGNFHLIALPDSVPRPASMMLSDGSLWLAWPKRETTTTLHPLVQASLVCHEAAHLVKNRELFLSQTPNTSDTIWESENEAMRSEWNALMRFCASQPPQLRKRFKDNWLEENYVQQKRQFLSDWRKYLNFESENNSDEGNESLISLPFLSSIYASLASEIFEQEDFK